MIQHIGIVACSAEGGALCYRMVALESAEFLGRYAHPEVSMHTHPLARYMTCINTNDWPGVAELMLSSADKLAKAGADFLICLIRRSISSSTAHRVRGCILRKKLQRRRAYTISSDWDCWVPAI